MASAPELITDDIRRRIAREPMFFVATAPLSADGHVNVSPKGLDTFTVIDDRTVAYLDFVGSGAETIAHLKENGRIVLMWCAFAGEPKIVRLHGRGAVVTPRDTAFEELRGRFATDLPARAIIRVDVHSVRKSCGYGVPRMTFEADRPDLPAWAARKDAAQIEAYQRKKNATSLDGLPGVDWLDDAADT